MAGHARVHVYGGLIGAALAIGAYVWRTRLDVQYLDAVAFGLPLALP